MPTPAPTIPRTGASLDAAWDALDPAPEEEPALSRRPTPPGANAVTLAPGSRAASAPQTSPDTAAGSTDDAPPTPSELTYRDALAAKHQVESSLSGLHRAVEQALGEARTANRTLAEELDRLREVLVVARKERDAAVTALAREKESHARVLEEQDLFVSNLIDDYEGRIARALAGGFEPVPAERDSLGSDDGDRPTMPFTIVANDVPGAKPTDRPSGAQAAEVKRLADTVERMERERDKSREMLRKLMKQRDDAQGALSETVRARDEARSRIFELKARILELQERLDGEGAAHRAMTQPAPPEPTIVDPGADPLAATLARPTAATPTVEGVLPSVDVSPAYGTPKNAPTQPMRAVRDFKRTLPSAPTPPPMPAVSSSPLSKTLPAGKRPHHSPPPPELLAAAVLPPADTEASPGVYSVTGRQIEPERLEGARISSRPPPSSRSR